MRRDRPFELLLVLVLFSLVGCGRSASQVADGGSTPKNVSILNVSYDPTRELYQAYKRRSPSTGSRRPGRRSP